MIAILAHNLIIIIIFMTIILAKSTLFHHSSVSSEIGEKVAVFDKLSNETERLLDGDTANKTDHMRILSLSYLFHHLYLREKVLSLISTCRYWIIIMMNT